MADALPLTVRGYTPSGEEIRGFADVRLQAQLDRVLAAMPAGTKGAAVAHVNGAGASLTFIARPDDHWSIAAAAYKPWDGPLSAEAEVVWSY